MGAQGNDAEFEGHNAYRYAAREREMDPEACMDKCCGKLSIVSDLIKWGFFFFFFLVHVEKYLSH